MFFQLLVGGMMIGLTVVFQALAFDRIIRRTGWLEVVIQNRKSFWKATLLALVVLAVFCTLIVEIWLWALLFIFVGALDGLEAALYYSICSFTTVGFGDVVLGPDWRLLGSIEAANGFLLFGWSTAFIFEIVNRVYRKEGRAIER